MIIYKITNKINGMMYIGRTAKSLEYRWKRHCQAVNSKHAHFKLQDAIKEFGAENFTIEQIDIAATREESDVKEAYWIKYYNSIENGYNTSPGGRAGGHRKKVKAVESGLVFDTIVEAAKYYGVAVSSISVVVDKKHLKSGGQHWISV